MKASAFRTYLFSKVALELEVSDCLLEVKTRMRHEQNEWTGPPPGQEKLAVSERGR